jgi:UDP-3-O-[3-hydroxymyristoyl] glucosamine N-acyltransferase
VVSGDADRLIRAANTLELAGGDEVAFSVNAKSDEVAEKSLAGCLVVNRSFDRVGTWSVVRVENPRAAFARVLSELYPSKHRESGIHPSAVVAPTACLGSGCSVSAHAVVGEETRIGEGCYIGAHASIGDGVTIGDHTVIHPHATLYDGVQIGSRVTVHAGAVIGSDGFGFVPQGERYEKFPQVGSVVIEDDVEIGANCCIDRAALGVTRVGTGTKLDNLVHIGHNCMIGKHVVIAAQTGFSGGVEVGDHAVIGGQTGVGEKGRIAARAVVGAKSGVLTGRPVQAGEPVWGIPARPLRQYLKSLANVNKIPELRDEVHELKRQLGLRQLP